MTKEEIQQLNLGQLINACQNKGIFAKPTKEVPEGCHHFGYSCRYVAIKNFVFQAHDHSTGIGIRCYIIGAGDPYEIINKTYWKDPRYEFNEFTFKKGAWDKSLKSAIESLKEALAIHMGLVRKKLNDIEQKKQSDEERRKSEVERLFSS